MAPYLRPPYRLSWHEHGQLYSLGRMRYQLFYEARSGRGYVQSLRGTDYSNHTPGKDVTAFDKRRNDINLN